MKTSAMIAVGCAALAVTACATKRYGRLTDLSGVEQTEYTCHDIRIEQAKVEAFRMQVARGAKIDWRSVAGFMGDYGIGNAMEKNEAEKSATRRAVQLQTAYADKHCDQEPKPATVGFLKSLSAFFRLR